MPICHAMSLPVLTGLYCGEEMTSIPKNEALDPPAGKIKVSWGEGKWEDAGGEEREGEKMMRERERREGTGGERGSKNGRQVSTGEVTTDPSEAGKRMWEEDSGKDNRVGWQFTQKQSTQGGLHATFPMPVTFSAPSWIKLCFLKIKRHKGDKGHATGLLL